MMAEDERSIANRLANEEKKSEDNVGRMSTKGIKMKEGKLAEKVPWRPYAHLDLFVEIVKYIWRSQLH
jgi:hypothetical protein